MVTSHVCVTNEWTNEKKMEINMRKERATTTKSTHPMHTYIILIIKMFK